MLNKNDKKNILVVILVLITILGVFAASRACGRIEDKKETPNIEDTQTPNDNEPSIEENEEIEDPGQSEDVLVSNPTYDEVVEEDKEENWYPVIDIDKTYYYVSLNNDFTIPQLEALDDTGNNLKINITYSFKSLDSSEFVPTLEFLTGKLGIYKITYYVENVYHYVSTKDIYIEIIDTEVPTAEGIVSKYNDLEGITEFIAVPSGSIINTDIDISFSDDDIVSFVEYYNASIDNSILGEETIEQEAMPNVIEVDPNSILTLTEEGEYHIRIYDRSGNVSEYIVTIDKTEPVTSVQYEQISEDEILVTITSDEEMDEKEGFTLSNDKKKLTKVYSLSILKDITLKDLAGNEIVVHLEYQGLKVEITQNDTPTTNRTLNTNDGDIKVILTGQENIETTYTVDDGVETTYTSGDILTQEGNYKFQINHDGYERVLEFSISSMGTDD